MAEPGDKDRIEDLRRRLYARGDIAPKRKSFDLSKTSAAPETPVQREWQAPPEPKPVAPASTEAAPVTTEDMARAKTKKKQYRIKILLAAVGFFVISAVVSSLLLMSGGNTISGENIAISVSGPFTVGGGEVLPLQVGVTNANAVPIQSATLIIEYPEGTQSAGDDRTELFIERLPLDTIQSGETLNIPLRAVVFGEENDEQVIEAAVEYRVAGSNATFFKEADPLTFKISSSPVILSVSALEKISSGQETEITLTVSSNSQSPLRDVLVKAEYPTSFDFTRSAPEAVAGTNTWIIDELAPEEETTITISGVVIGEESDELAANFSVGVANERDPFTLASIFTTDSAEFLIERPFIDVDFAVGKDGVSSLVVEKSEAVSMTIDLENTLQETLYDVAVEVQLTGNAISDLQVGPPSGFYNSRENLIVWDVSSMRNLETIFPGDSARLTFSLTPDINVGRTPEINMVVNVKGRRVNETDVPEELVGTAIGEIKVASAPELISEARYTVGSLVGSGPIPPVAEVETTYVLSLLVDNGTNDLSDTVVNATLPSYMTWLDTTTGDGDLQYNDATRVLTWTVGDVDSNDIAVTSFQVSILPSLSQVATTPTLLSEQRLRAVDDFTGTVIRASQSAISTELSTEAGYQPGNGRVNEN